MTEISSWVHLIDQDKYDYDSISQKLREVIITEKLDFHGKKILLKPSFVFPINDKKHLLPINTQNALVVGACKALLESGAEKVYIAESETILFARYGFGVVQIKKDLKVLNKEFRKKIKCVYLDECYKEWITPAEPFLPGIKLKYPKILKDVDVFISLPKLKCNIFAEITLSAKNNMGLIPRYNRLKYHSDNLHELVCDLWQTRPPEYIITDAIISGEGQGPQMAAPLNTNLLIFGNNGPAVDSICCELMSYDPYTIRHLKLLSERNFGTLELDQIRIENKELIQERKVEFKKPVGDMLEFTPDIHLYKGERCESGCEPFIRGILEAWGSYEGWEHLGELNIITGKNVHVPKEELKKLKKSRTLVYGDCAKKYKKYGMFIKGCAPDYLYAGLWMIPRFRLGLPTWAKQTKFLVMAKSAILFGLSRLTGNKYKNLK